eukprot:g980.t1
MQQQRASSVRALCSVQVTSLLSTLRGNRKFQDSLLLPPWEEADGLTKLLNHLRHKLATGDHVTDSELFYPFLQVVRAKEVSGLATHKALEGILNMLRAHTWDCSILRQVAEAVEQCKFEETMRDFDETVLALTVEVFRVCVSSSRHLEQVSRTAVCELVFDHLLARFHAVGDPEQRPRQYGAVLRQSSGRLLLDIVNDPSEEFLPFQVQWGLGVICGKDVTDETRLAVAAAAVRAGIEAYWWEAQGTSEAPARVSPTASFIQQIPYGVLNALSKHNSAHVLCTLLPLANRLLAIGMQQGNALWVEAIVVGCYLRMLQDHEKAKQVLVAQAAAAAGASASSTGGAPGSTSVGTMSAPLTGDALVVLLEHLEETFSANNNLPAVLHSISDACYYKQQSCLELCRALASLCSGLDTVTLSGQRTQRLSRTAGFAVMGLYYILKSQAELPSQLEVDKRREILVSCIKKFEEKPKKARTIFEPVLAFLPDVPPPPHAKTEDLPEKYEDWAVKLAWLFKNSPLMPFEALGEFFGGNHEDSTHCFAVFCAQFDMADMGLDVAMRILLQTFRLPKESQQIDRLMKIFSHTFYARNHSEDSGDGEGGDTTTAATATPASSDGGSTPASEADTTTTKPKKKGFYNAADACFTLAFSVIMLNVDQYNPQVKRRMEEKDFIRNLRKCNENEDFDEELLRGTFIRIRESEIRTPETGGFDSELMAGRWNHIFLKDGLNYPQRIGGGGGGGEDVALAPGTSTSFTGGGAAVAPTPSSYPYLDSYPAHHDAGHFTSVSAGGAAKNPPASEQTTSAPSRPVSGEQNADLTDPNSPSLRHKTALQAQWPKKPLYRLGLLNHSGKEIFEALVRVLNLDRFAASPAFSCVESLWRLEDLDNQFNDHSKPSSCVQLLFSEGVQVFRNSTDLISHAAGSSASAASAAASGLNNSSPEQLLAINRRPIKCLRVLFNFVALHPNRMVQDSSFVVVCILFALYSCWEEPQTPLYDPMLIPAGSTARRRASIVGGGAAPPVTPAAGSKNNFNAGSKDSQHGSSSARAVPITPQGSSSSVPVTPGLVPPEGESSSTTTGPSHYMLQEEDIRAIADLPVHHQVWDSFFGVGKARFPLVSVTEQKTGTGWMFEKMTAFVMGDDGAGSSADAGDDLSCESDADVAFRATPKIVDSSPESGRPQGGAPPDAGQPISLSGTPKGAGSRKVLGSEQQGGALSSSAGGANRGNGTDEPGARTPSSTTLPKTQSAPQTAASTTSTGGAATPSTGPPGPSTPTSKVGGAAGVVRGDRASTRRSVGANAKPPDPLRPVVERAFHKCDPFNVFAKLNARQLNLLCTSIFLAMLHTWRGQGTGTAAGDIDRDAAGIASGGGGSGSPGEVTVKPFQPPASLTNVVIGDGFEVLRFALRLCAKVAHCPIPQLRSAGKAVLETILCSASAGSVIVANSDKISVRTAALALVAVFRFKDLWGRNSVAEILSQFLERVETERKLFVQLSMVACNAVHCFFSSVKHDEIQTLFQTSEEILLVFRLLRAGFPQRKVEGVQYRGLKTEKIMETMMLLFHPTILPTLGQESYMQCLGEFPSESPEHMCKLLLALLRMLSNSRLIFDASSMNLEFLASIWCRTLIAFLQNLGGLWITMRSNPPTQQVFQSFFQMLIELQEVALSETVSRYTPFAGIPVVEKLVAFYERTIAMAAPKNLLTLALSIASKFFLVNLKSLQNQPRFDQAWLMVLRLILVLHKQGRDAGDEVLAELTLETLKNVIRVLLESGLLGFVDVEKSGAAATASASFDAKHRSVEQFDGPRWRTSRERGVFRAGPKTTPMQQRLASTTGSAGSGQMAAADSFVVVVPRELEVPVGGQVPPGAPMPQHVAQLQPHPPQPPSREGAHSDSDPGYFRVETTSNNASEVEFEKEYNVVGVNERGPDLT